MMNSQNSPKFTKDELEFLLKSMKIMEQGEVLLGIDIDKELITTLIKKLSKDISSREQEKIDIFVALLIKEAEDYRNAWESGDDSYSEDSSGDFDEEFGPTYPYSETLKILKTAIEEGKCAEINYYSASQGQFTKRKVRPESISRTDGTPYLNAYCFLRNDGRVFKLCRIKEIKIVD